MIKVTAAMDKRQMQALTELSEKVASELVRGVGLIYANALRTASPPHGGNATMKSTAKANSVGILELKKRISFDISGEEYPQNIIAYGRPVRARNGLHLVLDENGNKVRPSGSFAIITPSTVGRGKHALPMETPEQVYAQGKWENGRWVGDGKVHFVSAAPLRTFIKKKQAEAGYLISGWAAGARQFSKAKSLPSGFFAKLGGSGSGALRADGGTAKGELVNAAAHRPGPADKFNERRVLKLSEMGVAAQRKNMMAWYTREAKKILK